MKELSIEEKAKTYTELVNRLEDVKNAIKKQNYGIAMDILCKPYPQLQVITYSELKDSEDEKIIKDIISFVEQAINAGYGIISKERKEKWISLLEKQGNLMKALQISNARIGELVEKNYYLKEQLEKQGEQKTNPYSGTSFEYNGHIWGMCARDNGVEILIDGHLKARVFADDNNAKEMFIKALERVEEQNNKGYKLTDCDKNSWWEDFKAYTSCIIEQKPAIIIPKFRVGDEIKTTNEAPLTITKITDSGYWSEDLFICNFGNADKWELVEQKPTNKDEPMFHEGEWISGYHINYKILSVNNEGYVVEDVDGNKINILFENEKFHRLWTIQDAKDGDVLLCEGKHGKEIGIVKKYFGKYGGCDKCFETYCFIDWDGIFRVGEYMGSSNIHPATKEQRDLLFQKMKEAGYEWDAEKKELKKIEQEKDMNNKLTYFEYSLKHIMEEAIECGDTHNLKADADMLLRLVQKSAWSEEDERKLQLLIAMCDETKGDSLTYSTMYREMEKLKTWLKSLKDRVQPKQQWSEEDYNEIETIACHLDNIDNEGMAEVLRNIRDKYNPIIPQTTWKPSEEQMKALEHFVRSLGESSYASPYDNNTKLLYLLLEQLKKLK